MQTTEIKNYLYIIMGSGLLSFGVVLFFISNSITTGGSPGFALLLYHITGLPVGMMMIAFNIPLLLIGIKYLGKSFAIKTIISIFLTSFFIDFLVKVLHVQGITDNIFLASVFGGIFIGIGVGLILQGNASAGGSTIIAKIICAKSEIKPGQVILFLDILIVISSIYVFRDVEKALWSIVSIYVTARCIDVLLSGGPSKKVIHLVTNKSELLSQKIIETLGDNGSIIKGTGLHVKQDKTIILIIVELGKLRVLRELIQKNDPDAFMVVMDSSELLGRGH
jgi:uncharacterized membrane-anchored protein YitT (DUF2179 family)